MVARGGCWGDLFFGCGGHCVEGGDGMVTTGGLTLLYVVVGLVAVGVWYFRAVRNGR